jgi:hypothetical protein
MSSERQQGYESGNSEKMRAHARIQMLRRN